MSNADASELADKLHRIRHSSAHIMAQAVRDRFGVDAVSFGIGPAIRDGFYYDFDLPQVPDDEDLAWIENRMKEIIKGKHPFEVREVSSSEARELFKDEAYKLELVEKILSEGLDADGNPLPEGQDPKLTVYQHDDFYDLCSGPHVEHTGQIDPRAIKVLRTAGAYWRGDETRPQLTRIYGTAWATKKDLFEHIQRLEEAKKRDHRRLGKELDLFHFEPTAPGMPYWLPKGLKLFNTLVDFWREEHEERGYDEISSPLINEKALWEISGHWGHYKDNMFICPVSEHVTYGVKPMNCPNAMVVFNLKSRSYKDLPLRLSDCDVLHRNERSGTLHGLLRVQRFQQDDAHIFVAPDMIEAEYKRVFDIVEKFYTIFGMKYRFRLGTRPEKFIGDVETWDQAEAILKRVLDDQAGPGNYHIEHGDGAFYGPKVDIVMEDVLGRDWQMGTIQLDFQLPRRFECKYVDSNGEFQTPIVIHRVIYGSLERFIGILIEHCAGAFPPWIAPEQVRIVPITDRHVEYGEKVKAELRKQKIRATVDASDNRMNAKVRAAQLDKVPYVFVIGDKEQEAEQIALRLRSGKNEGAMSVADAVARIHDRVATKSLEL